MKRSPFSNARKRRQRLKNGPPRLSGHLRLERLDRRMLLSVLDFADSTVAEQVTDHSGTQQSPAQQLPFGDGLFSVGVEAELADSTELDAYSTVLDQSGELRVAFEAGDPTDQQFAALAAGPDDLAYFVSNSSLWRQNPTTEELPATLLASVGDLASAAGVTAGELVITDLVVMEAATQGQTGEIATDVLLVMADSGKVLKVDSENNITVEIEVTTEAGGSSASLSEIAIDADGTVYVADAVTSTVLKITASQDGGALDTIAVYTADTLLRTDLTNVTVLAQSTATEFMGNSLVVGSGDYAPQTGEEQVFFISQLGADAGGEGTVTRAAVNEDGSTVFTTFFDQGQDDLDPSALVIDTSAQGLFGNLMYMGTFGPSMGNEQDATVYGIDSNGDKSDFVT